MVTVGSTLPFVYGDLRITDFVTLCEPVVYVRQTFCEVEFDKVHILPYGKFNGDIQAIN